MSGNERVAVAAADVPAETQLPAQEFELAPPGVPYTSPRQRRLEPARPEERPFTAKLADGSVVTYSWYRFVDQPSFQQYAWSAEKKAKLQAFVEKIHANWPMDRDYMAPPSRGALATLDPALLVTPPKGLEVGYVPIVTRQAAARTRRRKEQTMKRFRALARYRCCLLSAVRAADLEPSAFRRPAAAGSTSPTSPTGPRCRTHPVPQWLRDGKFGIYTHWGVYSVPAMGPNATWYANIVYWQPDSPERKHWEQTYGPLEKFGYKDFIPMFTGEKFDAEEWADLFQKAGARFAGPVAEHHDGFAMWDTKYSPWNAAKMGPKRDVVGELAKAIKKRNMKFVAAFHHAENWLYFPTFDKRYDCGDPRYSGLYGFIHEKDALPSKAFLDLWKGKIIEVIDKYDPDLVWFDNGLELITDSCKQDMLAYYYNRAAARKKEVVVTYKRNTLPPGTGLLDLERGQEADLTYYEWITDSTVDVGRGWGYVKGLGFKTVDNLVVNLVDRVSKNGYLLLNVGPKPDGTIPDEAKAVVAGHGQVAAGQRRGHLRHDPLGHRRRGADPADDPG